MRFYPVFSEYLTTNNDSILFPVSMVCSSKLLLLLVVVVVVVVVVVHVKIDIYKMMSIV